MSEEAIRRVVETKNRGPVDLEQQNPPPDPIQDTEPLLGTVQYEKMVYVNGKSIPIMEDFLPVEELVERAGYAPSDYALYIEDSSRRRPLKAEEKVRIKNNMQLAARLKQQ